MIVNIAEINRDSPYEIFLGEDSEAFAFLTDNGLKYNLSFIRDATTFNGLLVRHVSLSTEWTKGDRHVFDPKVRETVFQILRNYLSQDEQVLVYVCDNSDGLHSHRNKLFKTWFLQADKLYDRQFVRREISYSTGGVSFYAGLVLRVDNLMRERYLDALFQYTKLLHEDK
jgi:hypothetical protein